MSPGHTGNATAVVIGASGGIGSALVEALEESGRYHCVHALSRSLRPNKGCVTNGFIDFTDEPSVARAATHIGAPIHMLIIATGILHEGGRMPEKSLRDLDGTALARIFQVNTVGPALALKHFAPLLARDRPTGIAAISARVGSISDNRTGGWYGYRASKAALNMIVKTAAIELRRTRPSAFCVGLHPGTVDTPLSLPFQRRVLPEKLFTRERAAFQLLEVFDKLGPESSGKVFAWDGREIEA